MTWRNYIARHKKTQAKTRRASRPVGSEDPTLRREKQEEFLEFALREKMALVAAEEVGEEKLQVGGALGEAAHEIREPVGAVGNVDTQAIAFADELLLQIGANAVEHLKFELIAANSPLRGELLCGVEQARIVRGDGVINTGGKQKLHDARVIGVDIGFFRVGDGGRFLIGALDEANAAASGDEVRGVLLGAIKIGLEDRADGIAFRAHALAERNGARGVSRGFHIDANEIMLGSRMLDDFLEEGFAERLADVEAELRELERNVGVEFFGGDAVEHGDVSFGGAAGFGFAGNAFTKAIESD